MPDLETRSDVEIDWNEVREALREEFIDPYGTFADYVLDIDVKYDEASKTVTILLPVTPNTTGEIAVVLRGGGLKGVRRRAGDPGF